jgi:protein-disulfide isomerase
MIRFPRPALPAAAAALALLSAPVQAFDLGAMSDAERAEFGKQIREYLLENPEVIIEAVNVLEQRQAAAEALEDGALVKANLDELENDGYSWSGGNPDGDITIVEFMDYRCGYCRKAAPEVAKLLKSDGNIRLVVKEFPILGEASVRASRFAIATKHVAGNDAYKDVHDALISFGGDPSDKALKRIAKGLDLDAEAILAQMDSAEVTQELQQTRALAQRMKISGTPAFVLGGELLRGYLPADQLQEIADEVRSQQG